jgi:hypothetical protein
MQAKAVRFAADVLEDDDLAGELEALSATEYAVRKHVRIIANPQKEKRIAMATIALTKKELSDTLDQVGERLVSMLDPSFTRLDLIAGIKELDALVNGSEDEDDDDGEEADDDDES